MFSHRLFNIVIAIALIVAIGLTVREAAATTVVITRSGSMDALCSSLPLHYFIHTEYVAERGMWVTFSENTPTGMDGGLIKILSDHRACSK